MPILGALDRLCFQSRESKWILFVCSQESQKDAGRIQSALFGRPGKRTIEILGENVNPFDPSDVRAKTNVLVKRHGLDDVQWHYTDGTKAMSVEMSD